MPHPCPLCDFLAPDPIGEEHPIALHLRGEHNFHVLESSNLQAVAFLGPAGEDYYAKPSASQGKLCVLFKNGTRYDFQGVPRTEAENLITAQSSGQYFNKNIRGNKAYHGSKVDPKTGLPVELAQQG